jgi:glycerate dehydrogenase
MPIVLLDSFTADQGESDWPELRALGEVVRHPRTTPAELPALCRDADLLITNKTVLTGALIGSLSRLRYIGVCATGTNTVDLEAARARGIAVTNVPGYAAESVAQHAFALLLQLTLDVAGHSAAVKAGRWAACPDFCFCLHPLTELSGKTLVVVGLGGIGRAVARIAGGFGMNVLAAAVPGSPSREPRLPLAQALAAADVVTLHCPLTPETRGLVDARFLAQLKPGAILINTSRGPLIDDADLIAALAEGRLGGVGLDVLAGEPPPADHPLTDPRAPWAGRVLVTPHNAWATVEARARLRREVAANAAAFLRGERRNRVV